MKRTGYFFNRLIFSYVLMILITILVLSSILYINFEKISLNSINTYSTATLSQTSYSLVYMKEMAANFGLQTFFDADVMDVMYNHETEYPELYNVMDKIKSDINVNSSIYSVYIYNGLQNSIYSTKGTDYYNGDFIDKDVFTIIENGGSDTNLKPIPRKIVSSQGGQLPKTFVNVYTFVVFDKSVNEKSNNSAVVVNINQEWLKGIIEGKKINNVSTILVIDPKANVAFSTEEDLFGSNISNEGYIKKVLAMDKNSGYFIDSLNGEEVVVNYTSSGIFDWKFISITPYESVMKDIDNMKRMTLVICFCILLAGLIVSIVVARRMNIPVNKMIDKINELEDIRKKEGWIMKDDTWKKILTKGIDGIDREPGAANVETGLDLRENSCYGVFVLKIDNFEEFCRLYDFNTRAQKNKSIMKVITEIPGNYYGIQILEMGEDLMAVVYFYEEDHARGGCAEIIESISNVQNAVKEKMGVSLTASLGGVCNSIARIKDLYMQALSDSYHRLVFGHMSLITHEMVEKRKKSGFKYPAEKEEALIELLKSGKSEKAFECYSAIIAYSCDYTYQELYQTIMKLWFSINSLKTEMEKSMHITFDYGVFEVDLLNYETIEEVNSYYFGLFSRMAAAIEEKKQKRKETVVENIIKIINEDYTNRNLFLEAIAEKVNLTPAYVGRMFKEYTLKSVAEYIIEKRLEKALELLKKKQYTINEISEEVGFVSPNYFFTVFKKAHGITPGEYRNKLKLTNMD